MRIPPPNHKASLWSTESLHGVVIKPLPTCVIYTPQHLYRGGTPSQPHLCRTENNSIRSSEPRDGGGDCIAVKTAELVTSGVVLSPTLIQTPALTLAVLRTASALKTQLANRRRPRPVTAGALTLWVLM
ncbi:hypothetical protein Cadr_000031114 [Camelus dromedarius]|uniref:Uncharacterized protein n=1 Tax=Camelus dromedarius TaxID=9838 RepID=A0A5N4C0E1_CAMDR|nr:hypothetical protein Cadr_000031114 [Camelus dromedarius]